METVGGQTCEERFDKRPVVLATSAAKAGGVLWLDEPCAHHVAQDVFDARADVGERTVDAELVPACADQLRKAVSG
ncbi:hypothetical protein CA603_33335 [Paraburkholderia hospita]|nr:hypothetical protein CA603_33335 [Paraburkholderia hospita]